MPSLLQHFGIPWIKRDLLVEVQDVDVKGYLLGGRDDADSVGAILRLTAPVVNGFVQGYLLRFAPASQILVGRIQVL